MNKVFLVGNIGKDAEKVTMKGDFFKASFSVAVSEGYYDKENNWVDKTEWFNCQSMGKNEKVVNYIAKNCLKGSTVAVVGKLKIEKFTDKDGNDRTKTVIDLSNGGEFKIIKKSPNATSNGGHSDGEDESDYNTGRSAAAALTKEDISIGVDDSDDLPF